MWSSFRKVVLLGRKRPLCPVFLSPAVLHCGSALQFNNCCLDSGATVHLNCFCGIRASLEVFSSNNGGERLAPAVCAALHGRLSPVIIVDVFQVSLSRKVSNRKIMQNEWLPWPFQTCVVVGDTLPPTPPPPAMERHHLHYRWEWHSLVTAISQRSTLLCRQWFWRSVEMILFPAGCSWRPCMCPSNNPGLSECTVCWKHRSSYETRWRAWKSLYSSDVCELTTRIT